jgi:hypothetical protein
MNYYISKKEEKVNTITLIVNNPEEILHKLDEIESKVGVQNILPFYDDIIELILGGLKMEVKDVDNYYKLYSDTFHYSYMRLSDAYRCLGSDIGQSSNQLYKLCPWYQRLWYRIKNILSHYKGIL